MEVDKIFLINHMLHLIFHRNKNQHGKTKWWKWLSLLKRTLFNLAVSLRHRSLSSNRVPAEFYIRHLATHVIPGCYVAFSVVVADGQFSTLGTVLLSTLARLSSVTGIDKELKAREWVEQTEKILSFPAEVRQNEDVGEVFTRPKEPSRLAGKLETNEMHASPVLGDSSKNGSKRSKIGLGVDASKPRKKKKKNAIDDLFSGLL